MELSISVAAKDRRFSKAVSRILPVFNLLADSIAKEELVDPIYDAFLVGLTDAKEPGFFQEVRNSDGFFQVLAGIGTEGSDPDLVTNIFEILRQTAKTCPFSKPDRETMLRIFDEFGGRIQ